jgi:pyruvyltransferase
MTFSGSRTITYSVMRHGKSRSTKSCVSRFLQIIFVTSLAVLGLVGVSSAPRRQGSVNVCRWFPRHGDNFGDALGPALLQRWANISSIGINIVAVSSKVKTPCMWVVGSVSKFVKISDVVVGIGAKNTSGAAECPPSTAEYLSLRGPLTRQFFVETCGLSEQQVPTLYGDPAVLLPELFPELLMFRQAFLDATINTSNEGKEGCVMPHYREHSLIRDTVSARGSTENIKLINPLTAETGEWKSVVRSILLCNFVVSQSLHGIIVAEAFNIGARWLAGQNGTGLEDSEGMKYKDYFASTGRPNEECASSLENALAYGPHPRKSTIDVKSLKKALLTGMESMSTISHA